MTARSSGSGRGQNRQAIAEDAGVEHRAAHQHGQFAPFQRMANFSVRIRYKIRRRIGIRRVADVDQGVGWRANSASGGFAAPMFKPLYTSAESMLMRWQGRRSAKAMAASVLPAAGGAQQQDDGMALTGS